MQFQRISSVLKACLALAMTIAVPHVWAENVAEYDFRLIIAKDKASIDQIQEKLKAGADFGKMAMENSIDRSSAKEGGLMKYVRTKELRSDFAAELISLKPGERSAKPRNSELGWFVIKLESVRMVDDDALQRAFKEREEKHRLESEREAKAKAEFEEAKAKFMSCARRATDLESEEEDLNRRIDLNNLGNKYGASELRSELARHKRKISSFERDCSNIKSNEEITKVCAHPAYQSRFCDWHTR